MVKRWIALVVLCLLARGWALAHEMVALPSPAQAAVVCDDGGAHADMHAHHLASAHGDHATAASDSSSMPDCRIVCDLGHAPALPSLWLPIGDDVLPKARPMGWKPMHGVGPWPPELPPPARV